MAEGLVTAERMTAEVDVVAGRSGAISEMLGRGGEVIRAEAE